MKKVLKLIGIVILGITVIVGCNKKEVAEPVESEVSATQEVEKSVTVETEEVSEETEVVDADAPDEIISHMVKKLDKNGNVTGEIEFRAEIRGDQISYNGIKFQLFQTEADYEAAYVETPDMEHPDPKMEESLKHISELSGRRQNRREAVNVISFKDDTIWDFLNIEKSEFNLAHIRKTFQIEETTDVKIFVFDISATELLGDIQFGSLLALPPTERYFVVDNHTRPFPQYEMGLNRMVDEVTKTDTEIIVRVSRVK
ncbi:hypothetical protein AWH56_005865 [Anaerobacillus isosaccharinicus]|uniref:Uncharacterized protein n=1 Tax=Anaerobacillus isosaccharinicus TaxID=1532552 RepID=A0A1S2LT05_9BACI|nr:hypothetical protein [Anaerobacillus isosaccharinicus]MBA5584449.1 hypothetical protein [Anaerobacillus isosaccharinicus]QOY37164.1 hypothetical protein AWH56_005865 [Anaerobacillus isosaccharinicus]